jgi:hypothetical protein
VSRVSPATTVGRAKGRSISELTMPLPQKESRTSTQAIRVPNTALMRATSSAAPRVSLSAATASGAVTAFQKASAPPFCDCHRRAASGRSTITDR